MIVVLNCQTILSFSSWVTCLDGTSHSITDLQYCVCFCFWSGLLITLIRYLKAQMSLSKCSLSLSLRYLCHIICPCHCLLVGQVMSPFHICYHMLPGSLASRIAIIVVFVISCLTDSVSQSIIGMATLSPGPAKKSSNRNLL